MSKDKYAERKAGQRAAPLEGKKCSKCGSNRDLQRHHITYKNKGKSVVILCRRCHEALHKRNKTWGKM